MKLGDILKKVGSTIIRNVVPGGSLIVDVVNGFLPKEKQLPKDATGDQIDQAVKGLTPEQQSQIYMKEIDVELAEISSWTQVQGSLAEADKAGASTRPKIALMMAYIVGFVVLTFSSMWIVAIFRDQIEMIKKLADSWPLMLTIIATPTALLRAYFGMRSKDKRERYKAAVGQAPSNFLTDVIKTIRR